MERMGRMYRWIPGLGALALLLALATPGWASLSCTGIGGDDITLPGTCTLSVATTLTTDFDVVITGNLVITGTGALNYGATTGALTVNPDGVNGTPGDLTVDVGGSITANGGGAQNGGNLTITVAGATTVDGSITANGGDGTGATPNGGSGGTIVMTADSVEVSGTVAAMAGPARTGPVQVRAAAPAGPAARSR